MAKEKTTAWHFARAVHFHFVASMCTVAHARRLVVAGASCAVCHYRRVFIPRADKGTGCTNPALDARTATFFGKLAPFTIITVGWKGVKFAKNMVNQVRLGTFEHSGFIRTDGYRVRV
jgi:hypothetical protein